MSFEEVTPNIEFSKEEEKILDFWKRSQIFEKSINQKSKDKPFTFYDGPPFATGLPHYGHLLASIIKDIVPRYWSMKGYRIERRFGWDTHGLPVEYEIDKKLGISGSIGVKEFGIEKYNAECRSIVLRYVKEWEETITRVGRWVDFKNDYKTMDASFMESVWWVFKQLWDKGLIYEGFKVMPYSTAVATPLSNFEAGSNYKDTQDPAITIAFKSDEGDEEYFLAWTTTPWTLPSNLALSVGAKIDYVKIEDVKTQKKYILSKNRLSYYYKNEDDYKILQTVLGSELEGKTYEPLFPYFSDKKSEGAFQILVGDHVLDSDGTGIVHTAPGFGEDDYQICKTYNLPIVVPVDDDGLFTNEVTDYTGRHVKDADKDIIQNLKESGRLFRHDTINHAYPFCWRSDTPLIYKAVSAWFVDVEKIKSRLIENNKKTHWVPEHLRDGRFGKWLENARDWNISRNRFWGNPMPIWKNEETGKMICVGSIEELQNLTGKTVTDLHIDKIDKLIIKDKDGLEYKRIPEVLDCWFESGSMPYAQNHYPFENKESFEKAFPADFIAEGLDQTRGWFYTLSILGTALFDKIPFKNVIVNGLILAEDGKKMSKRLKNYPDPKLVLDSYGADALRLYMIHSPVVRAEELRFSEAGVKDVIRRILLKWWNSYTFFISYAVIDKWQAKSEEAPESDNILDKWIVSKMQSLLKNTEDEMKSYHLYNVVPSLIHFIEDLTNIYIRFNRKRFWSEGDSKDKESAYQTLYYVLFTLSKVMAPFTPFLSEKIFQNLKLQTSKESVHLENFPEANANLINKELEDSVMLMERVILIARNQREKKNIKVKIPLKSMSIIHRNQNLLNEVKKLESYILEELNVRQIEFLTNEDDFVELTAKGNGAALGKKLGKKFGLVNKEIMNLSNEDIIKLEQGESLTVAGEVLTQNEVLVYRKAKKGFENLQSDAYITVNLDLSLDEDQVLEGLAREVVNRIQKLRKTADLKLNDRIKVNFKADDKIKRAILENSSYIKDQTLCEDLQEDDFSNLAFQEDCTIDKMQMAIGLSKI